MMIIKIICDVWHEHNLALNNIELEKIAIMTEFDDDFDENAVLYYDEIEIDDDEVS